VRTHLVGLGIISVGTMAVIVAFLTTVVVASRDFGPRG
jgi:hypothetical protein